MRLVGRDHERHALGVRMLDRERARRPGQALVLDSAFRGYMCWAGWFGCWVVVLRARPGRDADERAVVRRLSRASVLTDPPTAAWPLQPFAPARIAIEETLNAAQDPASDQN